MFYSIQLYSLIIFAFVATHGSHQQLILSATSSAVSVTIVNHDIDPVTIDRKFVINPVIGNLELVIKRGSSVHKLAAIVNAKLPERDSLITLQPNETFGHLIPISLISGLYRLGRGCYEVEAVYRQSSNKETHVPKLQLHSNTIEMCVSPNTCGGGR